MMVFVHVTPKERMEVLTLSTVSRYMVMRGESTPTVIPDDQMARFRFMLDYSEEAVHMNSTPLARGEEVRVIKGPLAGLSVSWSPWMVKVKLPFVWICWAVPVSICLSVMWNHCKGP